MQPGMQETNAPSPAIVFELLNSYQKTEALRAAIELGVFARLGEGPAAARELAAACGASERGMRILCDFLTIMGLVEKRDFMYRHTAVSAQFLDPRSPASVASTARFLGMPEMREPFRNLADVVRTGRMTMAGQGTVEPEHPVWVEFAQSMAPMMAGLAGPLGQIVLEGRRDEMEVLDVAAGHGLFGIEVAKQNPGAVVTALDWAPVLEVAKENARRAGLDGRMKTLAGSAFEIDFGGPYDVVLLTNFLHHFDAGRNIEVLKKTRAALKPGGRAAILEFVPNEDRVTPPMAAAFSMIMLASTEAGDAYTLREYTEMCVAAGFGRVAGHAIPRSPHTVVMAHAD